VKKKEICKDNSVNKHHAITTCRECGGKAPYILYMKVSGQLQASAASSLGKGSQIYSG
jgi:hypothetical protein